MKTLLLALLLLTSACEYTSNTRQYSPAILQTLGFDIKTDVDRDEFNGYVTYLVTRKGDPECSLYSMKAKTHSDNWIIIENIKCIEPIKQDNK